MPARLLDREPAYGSLTEARLGSYWNLVMPYALASGIFAPGSPEATGILKYMLRHGSRLAGVVRAGAYALYERPVFPVSGTDQVYGTNVARFLADGDEADQLVLSLYGSLAVAMTPNTFVSGEAASVAPLAGRHYRSMYLPPNGASNAAFLETLRSLLVHETRDAEGAPTGLELAFATPRPWLRAGRRIAVRRAPTSFGPVTYSLEARSDTIRAIVEPPVRPAPKTLKLRVRLPRGQRVESVTVNGTPLELPEGERPGETIDLSGLAGRLDVIVRYGSRRPASAAGVTAVKRLRIRYIAHDGRASTAHVVLPAWYNPAANPPLPLIISPHGRGLNGRANSILWGNLPGRGSFAVINPDARGRRVAGHSWGYAGHVEDLARMPEILRTTLPWLRIDRKRVYAFGGSMGGQETLLLLARHPGLLAGAAAFSSRHRSRAPVPELRPAPVQQQVPDAARQVAAGLEPAQARAARDRRRTWAVPARVCVAQPDDARARARELLRAAPALVERLGPDRRRPAVADRPALLAAPAAEQAGERGGVRRLLDPLRRDARPHRACRWRSPASSCCPPPPPGRASATSALPWRARAREAHHEAPARRDHGARPRRSSSPAASTAACSGCPSCTRASGRSSTASAEQAGSSCT